MSVYLFWELIISVVYFSYNLKEIRFYRNHTKLFSLFFLISICLVCSRVTHNGVTDEAV